MRRYIFGLLIIIMFLSTYGLAMADYVCKYSFSNGSGANLFKYCISSHGNVVEFTSPSGNTSIAQREGYALCDGSFVDGFDAGFTESGCGNPTVNSTSPLTITRNCDCIQFKQEFNRNTAEKELTITMTVKNICGNTISDVEVARYFDGDMGGTATRDVYSTASDSAWARDVPQNALGPTYGLMLTAVTFGTGHTTRAEDFSSWDPNGSGGQNARKCFPSSSSLGNTGLGDFVGRIIYFLGDLTPNQSKTVKVVYGRK